MTSLTKSAGITPSDRVYARTLAIAIRDESPDGPRELVALAQGDAHLLGRVRDRFEHLSRENPGTITAARALELATRAWVLALSDA